MPKGIQFMPGVGDEDQSLPESTVENSDGEENQNVAGSTATPKFRTVSLRYRVTDAGSKLYSKWRSRPSALHSWGVSLGTNLPRLQIVEIEEVDRKAMIVTTIVPNSVYNKIRSWGHTEWSSVLIQSELKTRVIWGILYVGVRTKIAIQWFLSLMACSALASITHVILIWLSPELPHVWSLILILFAITIEPGPYILFRTREFQFWFNAWKIAMIVDILVKVIAVFLEFIDIVQTFAHNQTNAKYEIKLNIFATLSGLLSTITTVFLFWLTIKVRQAIRDEDQASRILSCTERPRKVFCSKPFVLWAVGRTFK